METESRRELLQRFYEETKAIEARLGEIKGDMEKNDPAVVEDLQKQVEKRADTLARLLRLTEGRKGDWSQEEKRLLGELERLEERLKEEMEKLYRSFGRQMTRLKQGREASIKYGQGPFAYSEGAFFDKRN